MAISDLMRIRHLAATGAARAIRQTAGLSLREIAQEAGVDPSSVYRWEVRGRRPRGEAAIRWLRVLDELTR